MKKKYVEPKWEFFDVFISTDALVVSTGEDDVNDNGSTLPPTTGTLPEYDFGSEGDGSDSEELLPGMGDDW